MTNDDDKLEGDRLLDLCEKLGLIKQTEISVELDEWFEAYLDDHELSAKDLDQRRMEYVLVGYYKKNPEIEKELKLRLDDTKNDLEKDLLIISDFMSEMLEDLELGRNVIPE